MSRSPLFGIGIGIGILLSAMAALPLHAQVSVLTYHNDNLRTGQNLQETTITPQNIMSGLGKLFTVQVDDWIVAQPLYVPNLAINGGTHNVVFVATLNNTLYAVDADTPATIYWQQNYGPPTPFSSVCTDNHYDKAVHGGAGIISTPVIDLSLGTIYFVTKTGDGAANGPYALTFYAVNIQTGATIASSPIIPPATDYNADLQMSRPGLAEDPTSSAIYVGVGSTGCKVFLYEHGYVLSFNPVTATQDLSFATTVGTRNNGGIWQGGGGLALDVSGNIFFATADGFYDGKTNFGDSFVQLSNAANGLTLRDWFTPDNQNVLFNEDLDLSSTGPTLLPDQTVGPPHLMVGTGKTEEVYVVNRDSMGKFNKGANNIVQDIPAPSYLTGCLSANLGGSQGNTCRAGSGISFNNNYVYFTDDGSSNPPNTAFSCDVLQYTISGGLLSTTPTKRATFGSNCTVGSPSITANGTVGPMLWVVVIKGTATALHVFNAKTMVQLYNSQTNGARDTLGAVPRFVTPTVANGKAYIGGKTPTGGQLVVYGLLGAKK